MSSADKWMELWIIILNEISQTQKDKYYMFSLTCEIYTINTNKQKDMNLKGGLFVRVGLGKGEEDKRG
jgi:hypothetical protein